MCVIRDVRFRALATIPVVPIARDLRGELTGRFNSIWRLEPDGRWRIDASYSQYASTYDFGHFLSGSNTGNPSLIYGVYIGPPGQGRDFAPGFDPKNYYIVYAGSPTQNEVFWGAAVQQHEAAAGLACQGHRELG